MDRRIISGADKHCLLFSADDVLVCLGCYNKMPWNGWLISNRNLHPTFLEAEKFEVTALEDLVCSEKQVPSSLTSIFSLYLPMVEGMKDFSGVSFRTLIPFVTAPPS